MLIRLSLAALLFFPAALLAEESGKVVATIGEQSITLADVQKEIDRQPQIAYLLQQRPEQSEKVQREVLDKMINRTLILEEMRKSKSVDEKIVTDQVNKFVEQYGGKAKLEELLKGVKSDYKTYIQQVSDDIRLREYVDKKLTSEVKIDPKDVEIAFNADPKKYSTSEQVRAKHILITTNESASAEAKKVAQDLAKQVLDEAKKPGADFAALAAKYSQDPGSGKQGGDLGFFGRNMMVPEFEKAAFSLPVGQISDPVLSKFGYHIIKVEEKKPAEEPNLEKARPRIVAELTAQKKREILDAKVKELREKNKVKVTWD